MATTVNTATTAITATTANAATTGRPAARRVAWLDPDSLDVCAAADVMIGDGDTDGANDANELLAPPPSQTF